MAKQAKKVLTDKQKATQKAAKLREARMAQKQAAANLEALHLNDPMQFVRNADWSPVKPWPKKAMRLGFAVKIMGEQGLKSNDTRRHQQNPHLRVSIGYLAEIFGYLRRHDIRMYRMSSDVAPYATHPDMPRFHKMIRESRKDLAELGKLAKAYDIRLSFHPSQYIILNSDNLSLTKKSIADLEAQAEILDEMGCGPEAKLIIHVGGAYGDRPSGCARWVKTYNKMLSDRVKARLILENDDIRFSAADVLSIHEDTGVPCVWDYQHHWCMNPEKLPLVPTLEKFLKTWPKGVRPKMHFSCARTEMRELKRKNRKTGLNETVLQPPIWTGHADFNNPFETITFLRSIAHLETDIMLESKAKDLSLIRLRKDIALRARACAAIQHPPGYTTGRCAGDSRRRRVASRADGSKAKRQYQSQ